jgi:uncharacterized protein (TIGR00288 family)
MKNNAEKSPQRLAVLIDAENAQAAVIKSVLADITRLGKVAVKRIYGDFSSSSRTSVSWKKAIEEHAIKPMHNYSFSSGKNSSDIALVIDAMDLLHEKNLDGICLVTSDSDFTSLAIRVKEKGLMIYGFGENKTPAAFRKACDEFMLTEDLRAPITRDPDVQPIELKKTKNIEKPSKLKLPEECLLKALKSSQGKDGWANLGTFGKFLKVEVPSVNYEQYGFKTLTDLVKKRRDLFVTEDRVISSGGKSNLYVRAL